MTEPTPSSRIGRVIQDQRSTIVDRFTASLRDEHIPPRPLPKSQLVDHLNELLDELVCNLGSRATLQTAREHAQVRWETGFDLPALVREYGILLSVLHDVVKERDADVSLEEWHAVTVTLWDSAVLAVRAYTEFREDRDAAQRRAID